MIGCLWLDFFFFKQKTAYEMRISDWSSDVGSSDLKHPFAIAARARPRRAATAYDDRQTAQFRIAQQFDRCIKRIHIDMRNSTSLCLHDNTVFLYRYIIRRRRAELGNHAFPGGSETLITIHLTRSEEHKSELQSLMRISYAV